MLTHLSSHETLIWILWRHSGFDKSIHSTNMLIYDPHHLIGSIDAASGEDSTVNRYWAPVCMCSFTDRCHQCWCGILHSAHMGTGRHQHRPTMWVMATSQPKCEKHGLVGLCVFAHRCNCIVNWSNNNIQKNTLNKVLNVTENLKGSAELEGLSRCIMVYNSIQSLFIFSHASNVTPGLKVWERQTKISISWMD